MRNSSQKSLQVIVLAAGKGTRMQSELPKVLHPLWQLPLVGHIMRTTHKLHPKQHIFVVGYRADLVEKEVKSLAERFAISPIRFAHQQQMLGTGHAVYCSLTESIACEHTLILNGDGPFLTETTLADMIQNHVENDAHITLLSFQPDDPFGYGRIVRTESDAVDSIVEEKETSESQKRIKECNAGVYLVRTDLLTAYLEPIMSKKSSNEYYLTDIVAEAVRLGHQVRAHECIDANECLGINDQETLRRLAEKFKSRRDRSS